MTSRPAPLPHEPVTYQWFADRYHFGENDWQPSTWTSRIVLGPYLPGESIRVRLANGQLIIVKPKAKP